jgi:hypothetical protein
MRPPSRPRSVRFVTAPVSTGMARHQQSSTRRSPAGMDALRVQRSGEGGGPQAKEAHLLDKHRLIAAASGAASAELGVRQQRAILAQWQLTQLCLGSTTQATISL